MKLTITIAKDPVVLRGAGELDIYEVECARTALLAHFDRHTEIRIDFSGVTACDATGAQLLCAAKKSAVKAGKPLAIELSAPIRECLERLGVSAAMFPAQLS